MFLALIAKSLNFFTIFFLSLCSVYERPIHHICTFFFIFLPFFGSSGLPSFVVSLLREFKDVIPDEVPHDLPLIRGIELLN